MPLPTTLSDTLVKEENKKENYTGDSEDDAQELADMKAFSLPMMSKNKSVMTPKLGNKSGSADSSILDRLRKSFTKKLGDQLKSSESNKESSVSGHPSKSSSDIKGPSQSSIAL